MIFAGAWFYDFQTKVHEIIIHGANTNSFTNFVIMMFRLRSELLTIGKPSTCLQAPHHYRHLSLLASVFSPFLAQSSTSLSRFGILIFKPRRFTASGIFKFGLTRFSLDTSRNLHLGFLIAGSRTWRRGYELSLWRIDDCLLPWPIGVNFDLQP